MILTRDHFGAYFAETHSGHRPHRWQERLLDHLLEKGRWPERIDAPTGSGKTAAISVHVFAQALTADQPTKERPPRRLAMVVNRRVLVDDQYEYATRLARRLIEGPPTGSVLAEVSSRLLRVRAISRSESAPVGGSAPGGAAGPPPEPLVVARLRGGAVPPIHWRDDPTAVAVICATPDMWGSRVLFRGYGASTRAWARDAGLLVLDAAVVIDEAHLSRQALLTARQVARLSRLGEVASVVPTLQVVEASATPDDPQVGESVVGVADSDLHEEAAANLRQCLTRPKHIRVVPTAGWTASRGPQRRAVARAIADQLEAVIDESGRHRTSGAGDAAHTVGCYVNTVGRAVDVADELRKRRLNGRPLTVVTICGQVRPFDLVRLRTAHPGLLTVDGDRNVDVIVTTQSLEVGVDLDLFAVVTDLAPGPAIVQRAGRVNRRGRRTSGAVVVVGPDEEALNRELRSGPYLDGELRRAWEWLRREDQSADLSPWQIRELGHPSADRRRPLLQRPELSDVLVWSRTSDALAAEPELDLWLNEDLDEDATVGLVVRAGMPVEPEDARRLVADMGTLPGEVFSVPFRTALTLLADDELTHRPVVRLRGDDIAIVPTGDVEGPRGLRPGDTLVVDASARIFTQSGDGKERMSPPVPVPKDSEDGDAMRFAAEDVYVGTALASRESRVKRVLRIEPLASGGLDRSLPVLSDDLAGGIEAQVRESTEIWLSRVTDDLGELAAMMGLRPGKRLPRGVELITHMSPDPDDEPPRIRRVLVVDSRRSFVDDEVREVWSPRETVTLDDHQVAVAERVSDWARGLSLPEAWVDALWQAGRHHDDGKADPRFQVRLGASGASPLLAKSGTTSAHAARRQIEGGLPARWRHEQYSVVRSWTQIVNDRGSTDPEVVARLVGTSHGHGRVSFPHTSAGLLGRRGASGSEDEEWDRARRLFDEGEWDELIDRTNERYGVWGCAYLEAILRGADGMVSGEGR